MKKAILQPLVTVRKSFLAVMLMSALVVSATPGIALAQPVVSKTTPPVVKYLGSENGQLLFQMEFENTGNEAYNVIIKDEEGNVLFNERSKEKKFSKKFQFDRSEIGNAKLNFIVSQKEKQSQVFQVASNTRVIEDVVVSRL